MDSIEVRWHEDGGSFEGRLQRALDTILTLAQTVACLGVCVWSLIRVVVERDAEPLLWLLMAAILLWYRVTLGHLTASLRDWRWALDAQGLREQWRGPKQIGRERLTPYRRLRILSATTQLVTLQSDRGARIHLDRQAMHKFMSVEELEARIRLAKAVDEGKSDAAANS